MTNRDSALPATAGSAPAPTFHDEVDTPALILDKAKLTRNIRKMADFAAVAAGVTLSVFVEVNIGMDRCGVEPGEPALALARQIAAADGLVFCGLQAYEGHLQNLELFEERRARTEGQVRKALAAKEYIEAAGLRVDNVSGCGTGTHTITGRSPG